MSFTVLAINPGSTSTKISIFQDDQEILTSTLRHDSESLKQYKSIFDQYDFRKTVIMDFLKGNSFDLSSLHAVVGRGGMLRPIEGGTYSVSEQMLEDLKKGERGEHASNLGGVLAYEIANPLNIPSYIVDPVVVDEMDDLARLSGFKGLDRKSIFHALNQKAVAKRAANELSKTYEACRFVVAHLGGGISVGAHKEGRVVDVNNALDGQGPFSPERSGGAPAGDLAKMCFSGKYSHNDIKKMLKGEGGLQAYLGTNDGREVSKLIEGGDKNAELTYKAMAYQVAKEIGSCYAVLSGDIDAVIITGGLAYDKQLMTWIKSYIPFVKQVIEYPGEDEMTALSEGAIRVLNNEESAKHY